MAQPFEDPRKRDMRGACEIAIDTAGHELAPGLESFPMSGELKGAIKGDMQSLDGDGVRHCYYLRPSGNKPVAQWLANVAADARQRDDLQVFIVVEEVGAPLEKSCEARGIGLLRLTEDNSFELVVNPDDFTPEAIRAEISDRVRELRRRMETKLSLKKNTVEDNYSRVDELTSGMTGEARDRYIISVEQAFTAWDEWGAEISEKLDEGVALQEMDLLDEADRMIQTDIDLA